MLENHGITPEVREDRQKVTEKLNTLYVIAARLSDSDRLIQLEVDLDEIIIRYHAFTQNHVDTRSFWVEPEDMDGNPFL